MKQDEPNRPALEPELILRAQQGDREAMSALYEATSQDVYRTVHAMVRNEDLTLDIQQDTYVAAFQRLNQLRDPDAFLPWLRQIAVNQVRSQLRKKNPTLFTDLETEAVSEVPEPVELRPEASPELALDRKENARLVREILGTLTDSQRLLVGMYYYEELPVDHIARTLELSPGTVKTQLYRSRKKVEAQVRDLEAKGIKLYGLGPMAYAVALLRRLEPAAEGQRMVLTGTLAQAAPVTVAAGTSVGVHVAAGFFHTALGRVLLGTLAAAFIGGGAWGWNRYQEYRQEHLKKEPTVTDPLKIPVEIDPDPDDNVPPVIPDPPTITEIVIYRDSTPEDLDPILLDPPAPPAPPVPSEPPESEESTEPTEPSAPQPTEPDPVPTGDSVVPGVSAPDPIVVPVPATPDPGVSAQPDPSPSDPAIVVPATEEPVPTETEIVPPPETEPEDSPEDLDSPTLPITSPYPDSPGTQTIALGQTWTWSGTLPSDQTSYYFTAYPSQNPDPAATAPDQIYDLGSFHSGGAFQLSFSPTQVGAFTIRLSTGVSEIDWVLVVVTE